MAKKRAPPSKHSRAARRATSPSIDTDKSLKNVYLPVSSSTSTDGPSSAAPSHRPSVLAAHHSAGVTKKTKPGRKTQLSARARRRQGKGLEMAEAIAERTSNKLQKSLGKARVVLTRRKAWEAINKIVAGEKGEEEAAAAAAAKGWETDEETDEEMDGGDDDAVAETAAVVLQPAATAVLAVDENGDDEIL